MQLTSLIAISQSICWWLVAIVSPVERAARQHSKRNASVGQRASASHHCVHTESIESRTCSVIQTGRRKLPTSPRPNNYFLQKLFDLFQTLIDPNCCTIVPNTQWLLRVAINHEFIRKTGQINNPQCHRQRLKEDAFRAASRQSAHSHTRPTASARVKLAGNTTVSEHSLHSTTSERAAS